MKINQWKKKWKNYVIIKKFISTYSIFLVFCIIFYRIKLAFEKNGKSKENFEKYITQLDKIKIGSHDVGIALGNTVVAVDSLGLGIVPIGTKNLEITKDLNLQKYIIPLIGLYVGYPDEILE